MNVSSPCGAESEANTTLQKGSKLLVSRMMEVVWVSAGIALIYKDMHTFCRVRKKSFTLLFVKSIVLPATARIRWLYKIAPR